MKTFVKVAAIVVIAPVAFFGLAIAILVLTQHFQKEQKISDALQTGFSSEEISIIERIDWHHTNQICYLVASKSNAEGPTKRSIVMVRGDLDGGTWATGKTDYRSMQGCTDKFIKG